jgi:hypothetical protein
MASISVQPEVLDLSLYAGDGFSFKLTCTDDADAPINITGVVKAQIRLGRDTGATILTEFVTDLTGHAQGTIIFSLSGSQTQALGDHPSASAGTFKGVWDAQWTPLGAEPRTICQGKVECLFDVTR